MTSLEDAQRDFELVQSLTAKLNAGVETAIAQDMLATAALLLAKYSIESYIQTLPRYATIIHHDRQLSDDEWSELRTHHQAHSVVVGEDLATGAN